MRPAEHAANTGTQVKRMVVRTVTVTMGQGVARVGMVGCRRRRKGGEWMSNKSAPGARGRRRRLLAGGTVVVCLGAGPAAGTATTVALQLPSVHELIMLLGRELGMI